MLNYQLISQEKHLCITVTTQNETKKSTPIHTLELVRCSRPENIDENQQWVFGTINTNPEILENFPETSIDELEEIQLEQRRTMTTTINSPIFGGLIKFNHGKGNIIWDMINWKLLKSGKPPTKKCVTYNGLANLLTLETCNPNWAQCQECLKKLITSNDPLVQTQTSVANCSQSSDKGQAFEYLTAVTPTTTITTKPTTTTVKTAATTSKITTTTTSKPIVTTTTKPTTTMKPTTTTKQTTTTKTTTTTKSPPPPNQQHPNQQQQQNHYQQQQQNRQLQQLDPRAQHSAGRHISAQVSEREFFRRASLWHYVSS
ncbi:hypothetical protein OUZ56_033236 [Daphnia magna]|uniref:Uncharacterized protein n=1 Tax=Daphnia magna TaxID=35525 RepID=A0ABQ9ZXI3_9CRUS|nr:hypothetical protein OUZ56_033236 [Daphnia magna]